VFKRRYHLAAYLGRNEVDVSRQPAHSIYASSQVMVLVENCLQVRVAVDSLDLLEGAVVHVLVYLVVEETWVFAGVLANHDHM